MMTGTSQKLMNLQLPVSTISVLFYIM